MSRVPHLERRTELLQADDFAGGPGWRHGFSTRYGGVPRGARIEDHLPRFLEVAGLPAGAQALTLRQVHGAAVHVAGAAGPGAPPAADGLASAETGLALVIQTADCLPVLLSDPVAGVAGAAHAGWRGLLAGVIEATLSAMSGLGASPGRITAALGPAIGACCFEVGEEVAALFAAEHPDLVSRSRERPRVDLAGAAVRRLQAAGVAGVRRVQACTRCRTDRFFSHRGEDGKAGRLLSVVAAGPPQPSGAPSIR